MINIATVGTSAITEKFLSACRLSGRFVLDTAYSRDLKKAKEFANKNGFLSSTDDFDAIAKNPQINAVYIATPNAFHYEQSKFFLQHGKNVICEKSIVCNPDEYEELIKLAENKGLIYMEAMISMHCAGRKILHHAINQIGNISQARIDFSQRSSRYESFLSGEKVNIFDMSLHAGTLMDLGVYCVYAAIDLFGCPKNIYATANFLHNGADSCGSALFTYKDFTATLTYSKIGQSAMGTEIIGDRGTIKIGAISQYTNIVLAKDGEETCLLGMPSKVEVMCGEATKFADYIENYKIFYDDYMCSKEITRNVHKCMDKIKKVANINYQTVEL